MSLWIEGGILTLLVTGIIAITTTLIAKINRETDKKLDCTEFETYVDGVRDSLVRGEKQFDKIMEGLGEQSIVISKLDTNVKNLGSRITEGKKNIDDHLAENKKDFLCRIKDVKEDYNKQINGLRKRG